MAIFSPAKINLFLHITGRRDDGYHLLDSLMAFTDIGDMIDIQPAEHFAFEIDGPFASSFREKERKATPDSANIVVKTARALALKYDRALDCKITLTKTLPLAAGLGGGSSNAASTIWGLLKHWQLDIPYQELEPFMLEIGADVPACFHCDTVRIHDIGIPDGHPVYIPEMPVLLVNPCEAVYTADVFKKFDAAFQDRVAMADEFLSAEALVSFLKQTSNMLGNAAIDTCPVISNVLNTLGQQDGCQLARMSGSGASCFGLFEDEARAENALETIQKTNPDWWCKQGWLGRSGRY